MSNIPGAQYGGVVTIRKIYKSIIITIRGKMRTNSQWVGKLPGIF